MSTFPSDDLLHSTAAPVAVVPAIVLATARETIPVLHVINGQHYAGAERVQDLLAQNLPKQGYCVGFACVKPDIFAEMRQSRESPVFNVPMFSRFDLRAAKKIADLVQRHGYRLIHGHTVRTALIGGLAASMAGVPMVYHAHSPASNDSTRRWMDRFNGLVERWSLRRVARVIAVSQAMAEHIEREGFDPSRIVVVHNGVPGPTVAPPDRPRPVGRWTLGTVALFRPRKGLEVLLDAMALLRRRGHDVTLRAVGAFESPKYQDRILRRIGQLELGPQIKWTGFVKDIGAELQQMDLFVLPSLFGEGLPMVVLEAMAAGVPVVATSVAGVPEVVRDGRDGLLATPDDPEDLARAIAELVHGEYDWSALRAGAIARHAGKFSDRAMAAGVAAVYRQLLQAV